MRDDVDLAWERLTSLGWILHVMADAPTTPSLVEHVEAHKKDGERLGDALVRMRIVTVEQLACAVEYQRRLRAARSDARALESVASILTEMRTRKPTGAAS